MTTSTMDFLRGQPRAVFTSPDDVSRALDIPFSDEQLEAICAPLEPAIITAGAGAGKTTVMAARVVWLVGTGQVRPEEVLGLTFTRKAAAELGVRVRHALQRAGVTTDDDHMGVDPTVLTYDSFAGRVVAEHGLLVGEESDPRLLTGAARFRLAAAVTAAAAGPFTPDPLAESTLISSLLALDAEMTSHLVDPEAIRRYHDELRAAFAQAPTNRGKPYADVIKALGVVDHRDELLTLVQAYRDLKRTRGCVEFADQMAAAARLVARVPSVGKSLREDFRVVLLDEYQDTSSAQVDVLRGLFSGADVDAGRGHPVTAVGDPYQGIYGWRGAAAGNMVSFAHQFPHADGRPASAYRLTVNRRSGPLVLDVANALSEPLSLDPALAGSAGATLVPPEKAKDAQVRVGTFVTQEQELEWLAVDVMASHAAGESWGAHAVLTRTNSLLGTVFAVLTARDIPCEIVGLGGLLQVPEVADVVSVLRVVADPSANPDVIRLASGPRWGIGKQDLMALGRRARHLAMPDQDSSEHDGAEPTVEQILAAAAESVDPTETLSLADAIADPGPGLSAEGRGRVRDLAGMLSRLRRRLSDPVLDLVRAVIDELGLDVELMASPELVRRGGRTQVQAFVEEVAGYVGSEPGSSLPGLLAWIDSEIAEGEGLPLASPSDSDSVKLLTMHKAKGLEWPRVYLPGLVEGTFPSTQVRDNWTKKASVLPARLRGDAASVPQLGEAGRDGLTMYADALKDQMSFADRRLAYVAVTRAQIQLTMTASYWKPAAKKPVALACYLTSAWQVPGVEVICEAAPPAEGDVNPMALAAEAVAWPVVGDAEARERRCTAAGQVRAAMQLSDPRAAEQSGGEWGATLARWDRDIDFLLAEAREALAAEREVPLPTSLTASQVMMARSAPQEAAARLLRPMPRPPSRRASLGTQFHEWVERRFGSHSLVGFDDLLASDLAADEIADDEDLAALCEAFSRGAFADRPPALMEHPFTLVLGNHVVRGRIDAIYDEGDGRWSVIDWKTSQREEADETQLAIYRLAWAELQQVPLEQVLAGFYWVRTDHLAWCDDLPGREELLASLEAVTRPGKE